MWYQLNDLPSKSFTCGYCGNLVASSKGYKTDDGRHENSIYICPHCDRPVVFKRSTQIPDVSPGNEVEHLPVDIETLYNEARRCVAAACYTASVLTCRKLLMNIGVAQGGGAGKSFLHYVEYLADQGFVPPNGRGWVDHIRNKGNEANHEIVLMSKDDAVELIAFIEMLLKFIYEFPNKIPVPTTP